MSSCGLAQTSSVAVYTLLSGSRLTDDCPICARAPIVVPLIGTFSLSLLDQTPLVTRYQLQDISFRSGATSGPPYQVVGSGVYQVGGEVALTQELFLNASISNGFTAVNALCVSTNGPVKQPWPEIQIQVDQTNGTPAQVYHLSIVAGPVPKIVSIIPNVRTGDVRLDWNSNGGTFQLERAAEVAGPYSAITPMTTNLSFTDVGAVTNSTRFFYRLHPF